MAATLKHWRESASLILLTSKKLSGVRFQFASESDHPDVTSKSPFQNYNVLLLKRSSKSKFMPNLYVFPGGVATDSDFQPGWLDVFRRIGATTQENIFNSMSAGSTLAAPMFSRKRDHRFSSIPAEVAFRICAIRETFEESGVLLAWSAEKTKSLGDSLMLPPETSSNDSLFDLNIDSRCISQWRDRVNSDPDDFFVMCRELDLVPAIWTLYEWANWLTPTMAAENNRRFDTAFYVCCIDHVPDVAEDCAETVKAQWASPTAALTEHVTRGGGLAPPQVYELARLLNFPTIDELRTNAADPTRERVERLFPVVVICKDHSLGLLPGDDLYPATPELVHPSMESLSESLEELNVKFPNHNRSSRPLSTRSDADMLSSVQCTIKPRRHGNVLPNCKLFHDILLRSKL